MVFEIIDATLCFFTHLLLVFLTSISDIKRYNGSYLSCSYDTRPMKFTVFISELVEKINQFPANTRVLIS